MRLYYCCFVRVFHNGHRALVVTDVPVDGMNVPEDLMDVPCDDISVDKCFRDMVVP